MPPKLAGIWTEKASKDLSRLIVRDLNLLPAKAERELSFGVVRYGCETFGSPAGSEMIRLGPLFFIDESQYVKLSPGLKDKAGGNAIRLFGLSRCILARPIGAYTMTALIALLDCRLDKRRIVDAGAGEGILSLAALSLGAAISELIEADGKALEKASVNLGLNGWSPETHYRLILGDLGDVPAVAGRLSPSAAPTAVLSNIGYWRYGVTNIESILLMNLLPSSDLFIGAAYSTRAIGGLGHLDDDRGLLGLLGFDVAPAFVSMTRGSETLHAIIARRGSVGPVKAGGFLRSPHREFLEEFRRTRKSRAYRLHRLSSAMMPAAFLALAVLLYFISRDLFRLIFH